ncbi:fimbrial assembly chaperone [Pseudocitrobacter faecalis]|nr:fimbrial assembly chaperone [Pseudocitrobacter faecalis]
MRNYKWWSVFSKVALLLAFSAQVSAAVNVDRTRIVFSARDVARTLNLSNDGAMPMVIQVWADNGDPASTPDVNPTPVVVIPPVFKMLPGELRSLKLMLASRQGLAEDRETLFWLNIYQIAPDNAASGREGQKVILPLRLRMKIFIRPAGLPPPEEKDERGLRFRVSEEMLRVENPSPWYMSLSLHLPGQQKPTSMMIAPHAQEQITRPATLNAGSRLVYDVITDDGNYRRYQANLTTGG